MPLKKFSFENTTTKTPEERNWRVFNENSKTFIQTIPMVSPVGSPDDAIIYYTLYGPLVYFQLGISLPTGAGWNGTSYIPMPFSPLVDGTGNVQSFPNFNACTYNGTIRSTAYFAPLLANQLTFATPYTNAGSTELISIQGWYYRN